MSILPLFWRPIDHKLKYQVEKLVAIAETGFMAEDDPLRWITSSRKIKAYFLTFENDR